MSKNSLLVFQGVEAIGFKPATHVDPTVTSPGQAIFTPSPFKSSNKKENSSSTTVVVDHSALPAFCGPPTAFGGTGELTTQTLSQPANPLAKIKNSYVDAQKSTTALPRFPSPHRTSTLNQRIAGEERETFYKVIAQYHETRKNKTNQSYATCRNAHRQWGLDAKPEAELAFFYFFLFTLKIMSRTNDWVMHSNRSHSDKRQQLNSLGTA